ncbi:YesL family protein [Texcoconibacillus texcoconensis]|uniref:Putative membrane protein YesL n=1 Tax=Texcoconibacillus texcoconensis TaxID=1095777 RepID=A0A840QUQ9_9BACI|nr:DUF624 domain-containing protein [Texcoconibacillus texcoconensis]MBB5175019.1 putative membrane protein YesL [Texcoconibacillus texcoconensis]
MTRSHNGIYIISDWLMRLAMVNLFWVFFTLIGGVVLGVYPATVAAASLLREWMKGSRPSPLRFYKREYVRVFLASNLTFLLLVFLFSLSMLNLWIVTGFTGFIFYFFVFSLLLVVAFLVSLTMGLVLSFMKGKKGKEALKDSLYLIVIHPFRIVPVVLSVFITYMLFNWFPGILPFYSVSLVIACIVYVYEVSLPQEEVETVASSRVS